MSAIRLSCCVVAGILLWNAGAGAMCLSGAAGKCINFDGLPQISQQVVGKGNLGDAASKAVGTDADKPYTGPTVGVAPNLRRAPTVGYKWVFD